MANISDHRRWVIKRLLPSMGDLDAAKVELQVAYPIITDLSLDELDIALEKYIYRTPRDSRTVKDTLYAWQEFHAQLEREAIADPHLDTAMVKVLRGRMSLLITHAFLALPGTEAHVVWDFPRWMIDIALMTGREHREDGGIRHHEHYAIALKRFDQAVSERFSLDQAS